MFLWKSSNSVPSSNPRSGAQRRKKGATEYGPAFAISNLISTIITDKHKVLTVSVYLDGEIADVHGVSLGVPAVLSKRGVAMIVPIHMNEYETMRFHEAAKVVKETTDIVFEKLELNKSF